MKNIIAFVFCLMSFTSMAQVEIKHHTFNSNILSLLNPYYTSATLGYEYRPTEHFGIELTYGLIFPKQKLFGDGNYSMFEGKGDIYRIEPKYYFKTTQDRDTLSSFFISVKFYRANNSFVSLRSVENEEEYVRYNVSQKIKGVIPTFGVNHIFCDHFFVETSIGFGRRWITANNDYKGDERLLESCWGEPSADIERNGQIVKWRINLNFKVGVAF